MAVEEQLKQVVTQIDLITNRIEFLIKLHFELSHFHVQLITLVGQLCLPKLIEVGMISISVKPLPIVCATLTLEQCYVLWVKVESLCTNLMYRRTSVCCCC